MKTIQLLLVVVLVLCIAGAAEWAFRYQIIGPDTVMNRWTGVFYVVSAPCGSDESRHGPYDGPL